LTEHYQRDLLDNCMCGMLMRTDLDFNLAYGS